MKPFGRAAFALLLLGAFCYPQKVEWNRLIGVILASENDGYIRDWLSTGPQERIKVHRQDSATAGKTLHVAFITGLFGIIDDSMHVSVDVTVLKPDGRPLLNEKSYARLNAPMATNETFVMLPRVLDLTFEDSDEKGTYRIFARFNDLMSGNRHRFDSLSIALK